MKRVMCYICIYVYIYFCTYPLNISFTIRDNPSFFSPLLGINKKNKSIEFCKRRLCTIYDFFQAIIFLTRFDYEIIYSCDLI